MSFIEGLYQAASSRTITAERLSRARRAQATREQAVHQLLRGVRIAAFVGQFAVAQFLVDPVRKQPAGTACLGGCPPPP